MHSNTFFLLVLASIQGLGLPMPSRLESSASHLFPSETMAPPFHPCQATLTISPAKPHTNPTDFFRKATVKKLSYAVVMLDRFQQLKDTDEFWEAFRNLPEEDFTHVVLYMYPSWRAEERDQCAPGLDELSKEFPPQQKVAWYMVGCDDVNDLAFQHNIRAVSDASSSHGTAGECIHLHTTCHDERICARSCGGGKPMVTTLTDIAVAGFSHLQTW